LAGGGFFISDSVALLAPSAVLHEGSNALSGAFGGRGLFYF
jgi:hypothetical protein